MNRLMVENAVTRSLEVGFAYGFSSVWMMDALAGRADAHHTAIDPFQDTDWGGVGLAQVARLGAQAGFRHVPDFSIFALTALEREGAKFDFVYIDGNHRFDDVLVDFYLCDRLVVPGGLMALDDLWMPSIRSVLSFVMQNRSYELVAQPAINLAVIRKLREDDRNWRHFKRFNVHRFEGVPPVWKRVPKRVIAKTRESLYGAPD
jgi:predicted O-methyltransferase YrrM